MNHNLFRYIILVLTHSLRHLRLLRRRYQARFHLLLLKLRSIGFSDMRLLYLPYNFDTQPLHFFLELQTVERMALVQSRSLCERTYDNQSRKSLLLVVIISIYSSSCIIVVLRITSFMFEFFLFLCVYMCMSTRMDGLFRLYYVPFKAAKLQPPRNVWVSFSYQMEVLKAAVWLCHWSLSRVLRTIVGIS